MNLNSYLGLLGGTYREVRTPTGIALARCSPQLCDLNIPDPQYVVTLDADSVLLPEYCLRLVHLLEQHEYRDVAIAQTPYSAFPGSATRLERIAGASTDLQHIVHQGLTYYDATFWVGANAVIRKRALNEIAESSYIGDWEIKHYIRDRTVIEDTESTIDMGIHGWRLFNVPERMSYSATPPDFGSLAIQRRRWANGGLLIVPKLRLQSRARRRAGQRTRFGELFLRWNYMASICWSSVSLLILLAFPFSATLISPLLGLVALPYFLAQASDLRYCGYKRLDVLRIYGFNLVLLPVNLAGTISSVVQGITASKAPFARTPKVRNRTVVPPFFIVAPYLMIVLSGLQEPPGREPVLRRAEPRPALLRDQGLHRAAQLGGGRVDPRHLTAVQVQSPPPPDAAHPQEPRRAAG
jgi:cellulose synthase/poly-beta-1,6-N-acetylglucosamine synthase-like glycosyltransferase